MKSLLSCLFILISAAEVDVLEFSTFLERVEKREPRTNVILTVRASEETRKKHGLETLWNIEISLDADKANVGVFKNYQTGRSRHACSMPKRRENLMR